MGAVGSPALSLDEKSGPRASVELGGTDDPYWQHVYGEMLRSHLCLFAKEILDIEVGPHLYEWGEMVEEYDRVAINAARDHSKSSFFSYAYPIWRAWSDPGEEIYLFSSTLEQAMEFLEIIIYGRSNLRGMVEIPELRHLVPSKEDVAYDPRLRLNRQDVRLKNGSRLRAIGYGKRIRGRHPKYIVCDDVLNDEDMFSEATRRKNIDYYQGAITNMVSPDGQIVCVGTPYHMADLWGWLKKNPRYVFKSYPGIVKRNGEEQALFPWRWTLKQLQDKRIEIGTVAFTREILCRPISDDMSVFPSFLFPPLFDDKLTLRPSLATIRARGLTTFMGVDIARSANVGADYFVIFVIGADSDENHYIIDIKRWKGLAFRRQLEEIERWARTYDCALVFIESNNMQQVWTDEMIRQTDVPVKGFETLATNKYPLDKGVPGLRMLLENNKLVIPRGDEYSRQQTDIWIDECTMFGFVDGKLQGAGEHDDTVMAWWFASEAKKAGGFSFAIGDEDEEVTNDMDMDGGDDESWEDVMLGGAEEEEDPLIGPG